MKNIAVITGNRREFDSFMNEKLFNKTEYQVNKSFNQFVVDGARYFWVSDPDRLRGLQLDGAVHYGTYYKRKDLDEIKQNIQAGTRHLSAVATTGGKDD